jgi:chromosome segregation ATPase
MLRKLITETYETDRAGLVEDIYKSLKEIQQKLEEEIINKQTIIDGCNNEIHALRTQMAGKDKTIQSLEHRITESQRQLINKLLNDLNRMQQDLEWYKRTYENRSLLGVIKDKLKHVIS